MLLWGTFTENWKSADRHPVRFCSMAGNSVSWTGHISVQSTYRCRGLRKQTRQRTGLAFSAVSEKAGAGMGHSRNYRIQRCIGTVKQERLIEAGVKQNEPISGTGPRTACNDYAAL